MRNVFDEPTKAYADISIKVGGVERDEDGKVLSRVTLDFDKYDILDKDEAKALDEKNHALDSIIGMEMSRINKSLVAGFIPESRENSLLPSLEDFKKLCEASDLSGPVAFQIAKFVEAEYVPQEYKEALLEEAEKQIKGLDTTLVDISTYLEKGTADKPIITTLTIPQAEALKKRNSDLDNITSISLEGIKKTKVDGVEINTLPPVENFRLLCQKSDLSGAVSKNISDFLDEEKIPKEYKEVLLEEAKKQIEQSKSKPLEQAKPDIEKPAAKEETTGSFINSGTSPLFSQFAISPLNIGNMNFGSNVLTV